MRLLLLSLLAGTAAAQVELLREEAYNYRVVGKLPEAWKRQAAPRRYTFFLDAIPHADVRLTRQRIRAGLDLAGELARRTEHYRFPGTPKKTRGRIGKTRWGGREAWLYELSCTIRGVLCTRRVTVLEARGIFYELIETVYGDKTILLEPCRRGLEVFRTGFLLLTDPLPAGAKKDASQKRLTDKRYGYAILKPRGFFRRPVDPAVDPGVRERFERMDPDGLRHARVRLFEYSARPSLDPARWFDIFYSGFRAAQSGTTRADRPPPAIPGARSVHLQRFEGRRDSRGIRTLVYLVHAENGRVFVLRIRTQAGADTLFAKDLKAVIDSFRVDRASGR